MTLERPPDLAAEIVEQSRPGVVQKHEPNSHRAGALQLE